MVKKEEAKMAAVSFIISLIAIGLSIFALYKVGGIKELKEKTADALDKIQKTLRIEESEKKDEKE